MNFENAIRGARNPMKSWERSDSTYRADPEHPGHYYFELGPNDLALAKKLRKAGSDHRKYLRQIFVSVDITAPIYWYKEYDTYKISTVANSTSTMHTIHKKKFTKDDFSHDHMSDHNQAVLEYVILNLNIYSENYLSTGDKQHWYDMIQLLPSSYNQLRTCTMTYENLINMYHSRKHHKLDEWRTFCEWVKTLPYANELIIGGD
jgi:hypothetical protein